MDDIGPHALDQRASLGRIAPVAGGEGEADRAAQSADGPVDLGAQAAARTLHDQRSRRRRRSSRPSAPCRLGQCSSSFRACFERSGRRCAPRSVALNRRCGHRRDIRDLAKPRPRRHRFSGHDAPCATYLPESWAERPRKTLALQDPGRDVRRVCCGDQLSPPSNVAVGAMPGSGRPWGESHRRCRPSASEVTLVPAGGPTTLRARGETGAQDHTSYRRLRLRWH